MTLKERVTFMNDNAVAQALEGVPHAERETMERLLNTFFREEGLAPIPVKREDHLYQELEMTGEGAGTHPWFTVFLPRSGMWLAGHLVHRSITGFHAYGDVFFQRKCDKKSWNKIRDSLELACLLMEEWREPGQDRKFAQRKKELLDRVHNSRDKMDWLVGKSVGGGKDVLTSSRTAEQSLLFGHPFHPSPKSFEGFAEEDQVQFAPELGADFPLHFWWVDRNWVEEVWVQEEDRVTDMELFSDPVIENETALRDTHILFPFHPWQARKLMLDREVCNAMEMGHIINAGIQGESWYSTSSVRTVAQEGSSYALKLPLSVKITHFVRENSTEQVTRSIHAGQVIHDLSLPGKEKSLRIWLEKGAWMITGGPSVLLDGATFLIRDTGPVGDGCPLVVASLLERKPGEEIPPLVSAIRMFHAGQGKISWKEAVTDWVEEYLDRFLLPVCRVWADYGVSLEAHVQNTLVHLEQGRPVTFYIRDMEGTSVDRKRCPKGLPEDSPVLYDPETAWMRWQYYVMVNHMTHLAGVLGRWGDVKEEIVWKEIRRRLETWHSRYPTLVPWVEKLLSSPYWPAKANFASQFYQRGEKPLYVNLPNPLGQVDRVDRS